MEGPERASKPQQRNGWIPVWVWAGAVALVLLTLFSARETRRLGADLHRLQAQVAAERNRNRALASDRELYQQALSILSASGTRELNLKPAERASLPELRAFWHVQLGLVVAGQQIPAPASDRAFQLWVVPKKGRPISAGVFRPDAAGNVLHVAAADAAIAAAAALAISDEPAPGSAQPTTKPIWDGAVR